VLVRVCAGLAVLAFALSARAQGVTSPLPPPELGIAPPMPPPIAMRPQKVIGFRVVGHSKLKRRTASYLSHIAVGDEVSLDDKAEIEAALMSSELFESARVEFEDVRGGVVIVCFLEDKLSWIAAPTAYLLPSHWAVGVGYAESDLDGYNQKMLLYAQLGNRTSLVLATYLDPSIRGTKWQARFDVYALHNIVDEYLNPPSDKTSFAVTRESTETFLDAGALLGYAFRWWMVADVRTRAAYVYYRHSHTTDTHIPVPAPEIDGWDWAIQERLTIDPRGHRFGVTWGPYLQVINEQAIPGASTYQYQDVNVRAYYSWRLFGEHELELRTTENLGRHMPFNQEPALGGVSDLRGYDLDQFRGDTRAMFRVEYSVPVTKWRKFFLRAIGFFDSGYIGFHFPDPSGMRDYLPSEAKGDSWIRTDVGGGIRIYISSIVLPLLGFDIAYGLEAHKPEYYFELGLTDF
jgi:outer membrane protein insertion porin family